MIICRNMRYVLLVLPTAEYAIFICSSLVITPLARVSERQLPGTLTCLQLQMEPLSEGSGVSA
jgi:hypothetical protein